MVTGATSFTLYPRLPGESVWTSLGTTTGLTLMLGGQPAGAALEFAVTATNEVGEGPLSAPEEITL